MPATRSASTKLVAAVSQPPRPPKRVKTSPATSPTSSFIIPPRVAEPQLLPASLSFSLHDAQRHLTAADPRFQDIFDRLECKPYCNIEPKDPFRALVTSILGQQISWLAARSITHRFIRLYFPSLPEKLPPPGSESTSVQDDHFPTAHQVAATDVATLRTAGLSERKAQYVLDVASRFADGRLSVDRILGATDEELSEMLVEIKGVGIWTVHMFSIFSLRRPNVLPVGDLGVQRGVVRWFYHWHNPERHSDSVPLSPHKLPGPSKPKVETNQSGDLATVTIGGPTLPSTPNKKRQRSEETVAVEAPIPPPFTPSIKRTLDKGALGGLPNPPGLPSGLSLAELKARLSGKKVKGAFLTPVEMEALTECWKPYRSIGVYYMWALADESKESK